mgnify:CR=1 FL=1
MSVKSLKKLTHFWRTVNSLSWSLSCSLSIFIFHLCILFGISRLTGANSLCHFVCRTPLGPIDLLRHILDFQGCVTWSSIGTLEILFFSLNICALMLQALDEVRKIQPRRTLFTGMMHLMDHEKVNEDLRKLRETEGLDMQLSYDGLRVPVNL